jgi:polysaccharide biosynthesis transport protein
MENFENFTQTSTLNRFHETSAKFQRYKILLRRRWWFLLLTAAIAVCFQALRITGKATEYYALGRIVAGVKVTVNTGGNGAETIQNTQQQDFYGTQIEILESGALKTRALERIRSVHPELHEIDVEVRVTQTKGSAILNVAAVGEEPKYTRLYLDSLLDEYISFRKEMIDKSVGTAMNKVIEEVIRKETQLKEATAAMTQFLSANDKVRFEEGRNQAAGYLLQLESNLYILQTEFRMMDGMGLDNYLRNKQRAESAALPNAPKVDAAGGAASKANPADGSRPEGAVGGLARAEVDYLKAISDLRLKEAERLQLLKTYREAHELVQECNRQIETQKNLIEILRQQSQEEWNRRKTDLEFRIKALEEDIKEWKIKAKEANEKIVNYKSLAGDVERANAEYVTWKTNMERLDNSSKFNSEMVAIMERPNAAVEQEPDLWMPLLMWLAGGLGIGAVVLLLFDRLDDRMNSFSEFQALFPNESILGQIPEQSGRGDVTLIRPNDDRHLYAEAFRNLRSSILFKNWKGQKAPKLILITSAVPNEGKTTTVANLAITIALGGARVLLADADLRRGGINELFKAPVSPGFSDVLTRKLHWRDAVLETGTKGLHVLSRGEALDQTSELFLTPFSDEILREMGDEYDYVIFDSAPVLVADDTSSFAPKLDTVLFVVRMSSTMARLSAKALDLLYERQVNVGGVILNRASTNLKEYTYYNYASYYSIGKKDKDAAAAAAE